MSTSMYSGDEDTSPKQVMRNEFVKYRKHTTLGQEVDLLDLADGILLQWYSGFDAALCEATWPSKSCTCDNEPAADYPNVLDSTKRSSTGANPADVVTDHKSKLEAYVQQKKSVP